LSRTKKLIFTASLLDVLGLSIKGYCTDKPASSLIVSLDKALNRMRGWFLRLVITDVWQLDSRLKRSLCCLYPISQFFSANQQFYWAPADSFKSFPIVNHRRIAKFWAQTDLTKL